MGTTSNSYTAQRANGKVLKPLVTCAIYARNSSNVYVQISLLTSNLKICTIYAKIRSNVKVMTRLSRLEITTRAIYVEIDPT